MVHLLIKQTINDLTDWRNLYDQFSEYRKIGGEKSCKFFQASKDINKLVVLSKWESKELILLTCLFFCLYLYLHNT